MKIELIFLGRDRKIAEMLVNKGASVQDVDFNQDTPLSYAATNRNYFIPILP